MYRDGVVWENQGQGQVSIEYKYAWLVVGGKKRIVSRLKTRGSSGIDPLCGPVEITSQL
jgi:hypothetical protein